jgi:hypothetical protein
MRQLNVRKVERSLPSAVDYKHSNFASAHRDFQFGQLHAVLRTLLVLVIYKK